MKKNEVCFFEMNEMIIWTNSASVNSKPTIVVAAFVRRMNQQFGYRIVAEF